VTDDTAASGDRANGALDYAYVGHLPGRCTYCGFHVKTQGHRVGCHRSAPVTPEIRISKSATESKDSDFIDNVRSQDAREAARARAHAPVQRPQRRTKRRSVCGHAATALRDETAAVRGAPGGQRNTQLNTSAFNLGQLVGSGALDFDEAALELTWAAIDCGLTERELESWDLPHRGIRDGMSEPRTADSR
jgi:hypothetical protein